MAALTVRAVKLAVISGAAIPLIGYSGRLSAQSKDDGFDKPIRACDIPMYPVASRLQRSDQEESQSEPNVVQVQITKVRIVGTGVYRDVMSGYEFVKDKAETGIAHSKSTLDYVQNNPGDLPRVGFISLAAAGGIIIGYRRSIFRKVFYATVAGLSATALCYPTRAVDLSNTLAEDFKRLWKDNVGWPLSDNDSAKSKAPTESKVVKTLKVKEDHGQSKSEDKDLYSTRSS